MINSSEKIICLPDVMGACLFTGTDKIRNGFDNGDCLLMDHRRLIYAVADASERYPWASKYLLQALIAEWDAHPTAASWEAGLRKIWKCQPFHLKTTLSCILVEPLQDDMVRVSILHGGDSMVIIADTHEHVIRFQTKVDMNFAGRGQEVTALIQMIITNPHEHILLATDGFNDVVRGGQKTVLQFFDLDVDQIGNEITRIITTHLVNKEHDDIGIIMLNPLQLISKKND